MSHAALLLAEADAFRRAGQLSRAEQTYRRAIQADSANAAAYNLLGLVLASQGKLDEAIGCFQTAVQRDPDYAQAHNNLGVALEQQGKLDEAAAAFRQAVQVRPDYAEAHNNLGVAMEKQGRLDEAVACCSRAAELKPDYVEAYNSLGVAFERQDKLDEAEACFRRAVELRPDFAEAHSNLGGVLDRQDKLEPAAAALRRALALKPDSPEAHVNLGLVLERLGRLDEALAVLQRAVALEPKVAEVHMNLGLVLERQGNVEEAMTSFRRALVQPDCAQAHLNYALALLRSGNFDEGWREYEWRAGCEGVGQKILPGRRWQGDPIEGRTILVCEEQGAGDTLQFVRYAELLKRQGATVVVQCRPQLIGLLESCRGVDRVTSTLGPLPPYDVYVSLPSLPGILGTSLVNIPANVPYLFADAALVGEWKDELTGKDFKVGIAWQGDPNHKANRYRSFPLEKLAPLAGMPGVGLFSLQFGAGREQLADLPPACPITDLGDRLGDFHSTAAIMRNLDLVITCDSAPAHLAGAVGVPVWVALAFVPDWRWLLARTDSPWYPTMRLYRQSRPGDWEEVFRRIAIDLAAIARQRG